MVEISLHLLYLDEFAFLPQNLGEKIEASGKRIHRKWELMHAHGRKKYVTIARVTFHYGPNEERKNWLKFGDVVFFFAFFCVDGGCVRVSAVESRTNQVCPAF